MHLALNYNLNIPTWVVGMLWWDDFPLQNVHTINHLVKRFWVPPSSHTRAPGSQCQSSHPSIQKNPI